ncbi:MAG TPA: 50S ribosomal protein L15 [Candidatus Xenobia bacterium]|jgi:large subunit ribosomal protein L15
MDLTSLSPSPGSKHKRKRVGRGHGCHGTYSGKGCKGQKARSGGNKKPGFEGGQTPWYRRLPKYKGFKSLNKVAYSLVNLEHLEGFDAGTTVTLEVMQSAGLVRRLDAPVKVLGAGQLTKKLTVQAHAFSASATQSIEAAGGKAEVI